MTFLVTNLATFALKIGSAPNFRPSFQFFNWQTAAVGAVVSGATMVRQTLHLLQITFCASGRDTSLDMLTKITVPC